MGRNVHEGHALIIAPCVKYEEVARDCHPLAAQHGDVPFSDGQQPLEISRDRPQMLNFVMLAVDDPFLQMHLVILHGEEEIVIYQAAHWQRRSLARVQLAAPDAREALLLNLALEDDRPQKDFGTRDHDNLTVCVGIRRCHHFQDPFVDDSRSRDAYATYKNGY